jgi:hypothetical protein
LSCDWSPSQTFIGSELDTNMVVSSANVTSSHSSAVGASEVNKLYKVGDKTALWGTAYGILQTDDLELPKLTWKVRPLRKQCMILARKVLQPPWMSLWRSVSSQTVFNLPYNSVELVRRRVCRSKTKLMIWKIVLGRNKFILSFQNDPLENFTNRAKKTDWEIVQRVWRIFAWFGDWNNQCVFPLFWKIAQF